MYFDNTMALTIWMITYQAPVKVLDVYYVLSSQFYKTDSIVPTSQARKLRNEEVPLLVKGQDGAAGIRGHDCGATSRQEGPLSCRMPLRHPNTKIARVSVLK